MYGGQKIERGAETDVAEANFVVASAIGRALIGEIPEGMDIPQDPNSNSLEIAFLEAARNLHTEGLSAIFDEYAPAIYKYVLRLCHDPIVTDNIVGDVFAQVIEQFSGGKGPRTNLRSYLYQTAYHLVVDLSRDLGHVAPLEMAAGWRNVYEVTTPDQIENRMIMELIITAMNTELTEDQRHVVILRFLEDFSLKETAEIIGKEVGNIKVIQNRGITRLRAALKDILDAGDD